MACAASLSWWSGCDKSRWACNMTESATEGLRLWVVYYDSDLLELAVIVWNGRFYGRTKFYTTRSLLDELQTRLRGFPTTRRDVREFELGTFDANQAGGGLRVRLERSDSAGHCKAQVSLRSREPEPLESVALSFTFEPAMIDSFVSELSALTVEEPRPESLAQLRAAR